MLASNAGRVNLLHGGSVLDLSTGTFDQTRYGKLWVDVERTTAGNGHAQVKARTAKLNGGLTVRTLSPFSPAAGNTFRPSRPAAAAPARSPPSAG